MEEGEDQLLASGIPGPQLLEQGRGGEIELDEDREEVPGFDRRAIGNPQVSPEGPVRPERMTFRDVELDGKRGPPELPKGRTRHRAPMRRG